MTIGGPEDQARIARNEEAARGLRASTVKFVSQCRGLNMPDAEIRKGVIGSIMGYYQEQVTTREWDAEMMRTAETFVDDVMSRGA